MGRRPKAPEPKKKKRKKVKNIISSPKGMADILPVDDFYRRKIIKVVENLADSFDFKKIELPIAEETEIFEHGTGQTTEIVQKQMFNFKTPGRDNLTLRPEFTPGLIRSYIQNGMSNKPKPVKLFTYGPLFRYESPQRGRFRQFWQCDFEIIGEKDPIYDALIIKISMALFNDLKIRDLVAKVNTLGCDNCRNGWKKKLKTFYSGKQKKLCSDCQRRYKDNILRILDCKKEGCREISENAPKMIDNLCSICRKHFMAVLEFLEELNIPFEIDNHLVRGLDYYTRTVFEITKKDDDLAMCGGGRYDYLVEILGGQPTPAVGVGIGMERIVGIMKSQGIGKPAKENKAFLVLLGDLAKRKGIGLLGEFRKNGIHIAEAFGKDSLRAQLKVADNMGIDNVVILGQKEANEGTVILRNMKSGAQETVAIDKMIGELKKRLMK